MTDGICELCEVEYDAAEGENYIEPANLLAIERWHAGGHIGAEFDDAAMDKPCPSRGVS